MELTAAKFALFAFFAYLYPTSLSEDSVTTIGNENRQGLAYSVNTAIGPPNKNV